MNNPFESLIDLLFGTAPTKAQIEAEIEAQRIEALIMDLKLRFIAGEKIDGAYLRTIPFGEDGKADIVSGISHFEEGRPQYNNYCADVEVVRPWSQYRLEREKWTQETQQQSLKQYVGTQQG